MWRSCSDGSTRTPHEPCRQVPRSHHLEGFPLVSRAVQKSKEPQSTRQRLQAVIKESRNIMRKDAGLNGELDRLPQLAWLLFLRAYDDFEEARQVTDRDYKPAIEGDFRWSHWARGTITGDPLLAFVNAQLIPHLRGLQGSGKPGDPRDTLAQIFADVNNRMLSGYLFKDLISQLDKISFANRDDIHTMAHLYESMLKEMRDAAGDSGEFYTPRPLVRFIVDMVDPQVGETVLDPAMGTAGFLVEAYEHLMEGASTARQREIVKASVRGIEKKPMPLLLAQMNLLLHEIDEPQVVRQNALQIPMRELRSAPADVILTNPPFGGEEEQSILTNFPAAMRTSETVWLFLQSVMARLEKSKARPARCGIVVPNSVLFDQGIGAKIKAHLMEHFNLHTVIRLPNGVFAPYTLIPSNVLFFDKGKQDDHVWFYEHPLPEGRKNYTKTKPLAFDEFEACEKWWGGLAREGRVQTDQAWQVSVADIVAGGFNLDLQNPHRPVDLQHRAPTDLVTELMDVQEEILGLLRELEKEIQGFEQ